MDSAVAAVGADNAMAATSLLGQDASQFTNDASYEYVWAIKTFKYAETHFKLISSFDPSKLRLTKFDDQIYRTFKRFFKNFKVDVINDSELKEEESKARWRPFCELFKGKVEDYNFGTLLRLDCSKGYSEDNTILVTRIQFIAIELARNRRGLNQIHLENGQTKENENKTEKPTDELKKEHEIEENELKDLKITEKEDLKQTEKEFDQNLIEGKEQTDEIKAS
eukprot:Seg153.13 transcript_id=Seg153.13/GoldUCD/mRNA.D3Y31 product="Protein PBDC1" protein_id=Seg153.13/GoldUCD/D3Y31